MIAKALLEELITEFEREQRGERTQPWGVFFQDYGERVRRLNNLQLQGALLLLLAECTRTLAGYRRDVEGARQTVELLLEARS